MKCNKFRGFSEYASVSYREYITGHVYRGIWEEIIIICNYQLKFEMCNMQLKFYIHIYVITSPENTFCKINLGILKAFDNLRKCASGNM